MNRRRCPVRASAVATSGAIGTALTLPDVGVVSLPAHEPMISHPRSVQYRHVARCAISGAVAVLTGLASLGAFAGHNAIIAVPLLAATTGFALASRNGLRLSRRHRVGADAEDAVRRALSALAREGWTIQHGADWPGGGDIDHLVRSPQGLGFAIETKTRSFNQRQLDRTLNIARWAAARRRRYPQGVVPVLCVVRSRGLQHNYAKVLVVSLDRLVPALRKAAAPTPVTARIRRAVPADPSAP